MRCLRAEGFGDGRHSKRWTCPSLSPSASTCIALSLSPHSNSLSFRVYRALCLCSMLYKPDILFGFLGGSRTRAVTGVMMMVMMMMMMMMLVMTATDSGKYAIAELT